MKPKILFITLLIVLASSLLIAGAGTEESSKKVNSYEANFRSENVNPIIDKAGGKDYFKIKIKLKDDFSNLKFKAEIPEVLTQDNIKEIKMVIFSDKTKIPIKVDPSSSFFDFAKLKNGDMFRYGGISGYISNEILGNSGVMVSFFEIPNQKKATYNVVINNNNQHPEILLPFGNLDNSPEIDKILFPEKGGRY